MGIPYTSTDWVLLEQAEATWLPTGPTDKEMRYQTWEMASSAQLCLQLWELYMSLVVESEIPLGDPKGTTIDNNLPVATTALPAFLYSFNSTWNIIEVRKKHLARLKLNADPLRIRGTFCLTYFWTACYFPITATLKIKLFTANRITCREPWLSLQM